MGDFHRVVVTPGSEQSLIDRAKAAREAEKAQAPIDEMAATREHARKHAQRVGVMHTDGNGFEHRKLMRVETPGAPNGQVRVGGMVTTKAAALNAGLIDEKGELTAKGRAVGGEAPAASSQRPQAEQRASIPAGMRLAEGFHYVTLRSGKTLADASTEELTSLQRQLRNAELWGGPERQAFTSDLQGLKAELDRRANPNRVETAQAQAEQAAAAEAPADEVSVDDSVDSNELIEQAFAEGRHAEVVDAAVPLIDGLSRSSAYQSALDAYVKERTLPTAETYEAIARELDMDPGDASEAINFVAGAYRAEAHDAVKPILKTDEAIDGFVSWLRKPANRAVTQRALAIHIRGGSTTGWKGAARAFLSTLRESK